MVDSEPVSVTCALSGNTVSKATVLQSRKEIEPNSDVKITLTAQRAFRLLYGVLELSNNGDSTCWGNIFPTTSAVETCEKLVNFIGEQIPAVLECLEDVSSAEVTRDRVNRDSSLIREDQINVEQEFGQKPFDLLHRLANNLEAEHRLRSLDASISPAAAGACIDSITDAFLGCFSTVLNPLTSDNSRTLTCTPRNGVKMASDEGVDQRRLTSEAAQIQELRASIKKRSSEISELEEQLLGGNINQQERLAIEIRVKRLERALLDDKIDLSAVSASSKFSADINRLDSAVAGLETRQSEVENRQDDLESRFESEKREKDRELQAIKQQIDKLLELDTAREMKQDKLRRTVESVQEEQRCTRQVVDAVDNRQRKQTIILHGLQPASAKEELLKLLPVEIGQQIDRVHPITKVAREGSVPMAVHFLRVSACEEARDFIASREFKANNGGRIRCAQDESELSRIGGSRLRAISDLLDNKFGEAIEIRRDFVRFDGIKYMAAEFARREITIGGTTIDIDRAVKDNTEVRENPAVKTFVDGRRVAGVRLPQKRRASDEGTATVARGRGQSRPTHVQRERNENLTNNLPAIDGVTGGGVQVFNHGHKAHGAGRARDGVMRVSSRTNSVGQPARFFYRFNNQTQRL